MRRVSLSSGISSSTTITLIVSSLTPPPRTTIPVGGVTTITSEVEAVSYSTTKLTSATPAETTFFLHHTISAVKKCIHVNIGPKL